MEPFSSSATLQSAFVLPSCVFEDLPNVFENQEFGEEKQKGSAVCLFSASLGAGENVTQLASSRKLHHYSNTG